MIKVPANRSRQLASGYDIKFYTTELDIESLEVLFGVKTDPDSISGWMDVVSSVVEHRDNLGKCLVYCAAGKGILHTEDGDAFLQRGQFTVFDDRFEHSLEVFRKMKILVLGIKRFSKSKYNRLFEYKPLRYSV